MARTLKYALFIILGFILILLSAWHILPRWYAADLHGVLDYKNSELLMITPQYPEPVHDIHVGFAQFSVNESYRSSEELYYSESGWIFFKSVKISFVFMPPEKKVLNENLLPLIQSLHEKREWRVDLLPEQYFDDDGKLHDVAIFDLQMLLGDKVPMSFIKSLPVGPSEFAENLTALNMKLLLHLYNPQGVAKIRPFSTPEGVGVIYFNGNQNEHWSTIQFSSHDRKIHQQIAFATPDAPLGLVTEELKLFLSSYTFSGDKCCYSAQEVKLIAEQQGIKPES